MPGPQQTVSKHRRNHSVHLIANTSACKLAAMLRCSRPGVQSASSKTPKIQVFLGVTQPPGVAQPLYSRGHNKTQTYNICPSLMEIGSKTAEKNSAQTDKPTDTTKIMVTWPWTNQLRNVRQNGQAAGAGKYRPRWVWRTQRQVRQCRRAAAVRSRQVERTWSSCDEESPATHWWTASATWSDLSLSRTKQQKFCHSF